MTHCLVSSAFVGRISGIAYLAYLYQAFLGVHTRRVGVGTFMERVRSPQRAAMIRKSAHPGSLKVRSSESEADVIGIQKMDLFASHPESSYTYGVAADAEGTAVCQ